MRCDCLSPTPCCVLTHHAMVAVPAGPQVMCWGCGSRLQYTNARLVQCPTCGAYTASDNDSRERRKRDASWSQWASRAPFMLVSLGMVGGCIGVGMFYSMPWLLDRLQAGLGLRWLLWTLGVWLSVNTAWNYAVCALASVGRTFPLRWTPKPLHLCRCRGRACWSWSRVVTRVYACTVNPETYLGQRLCYRCNYPKPPGFHHCSLCGVCVFKVSRRQPISVLEVVCSHACGFVWVNVRLYCLQDGPPLRVHRPLYRPPQPPSLPAVPFVPHDGFVVHGHPGCCGVPSPSHG